MLVILIKTTKTNYFKKHKKILWSWQGLNLRPPPCKGGALPAELQPQFYIVGLGRFELPTPALSERYSNQLSYKPRIKNLYYIVRMSKVY